MSATSPTAIKIMTYNILVGGKIEGAESRIPALEAVIRNCDPDILGIQEANDVPVIHELADRLGMQAIIGYAPNGYNVAFLTKFHIRAWSQHINPIFQKGCIEAVIDIPGEQLPWHIFVTHLMADFHKVYIAEKHRTNELKTVINAMNIAKSLGRPHVLLGDFNTLSANEPFVVTNLIKQVIEFDEKRKLLQTELEGHPNMEYIVPRPLHFLLPMVRRIPETPILAGLTSFGVNMLVSRNTTAPLVEAGYIDCLRALHDPSEMVPTCPLPKPAGRIDYIWADPLAAPRLASCDVVIGGADCPVNDASDHRPVLAQFAKVAAIHHANEGRLMAESHIS